MATVPVSQEVSDAQLLEQFLELADHESFAKLVDRHQRLVLGVCQRTLGNRQDAEDAFQATFILLATQGRKIRRRDAISSWLYGVAYRISVRIRRQRQARRQTGISAEPIGHVQDFWQTLAEQDNLRRLDAELARLPRSLREPLVLRYLRGLSNERVASQLGTTVAAVEGRLKRAKSRLRIQLLRQGITWSAAVTTLVRSHRTVRAQDTSHLIDQTIKHALTAAAGTAGTEVDALPAMRLARVEAVSMQMIRWSKFAFLGITVAGAIGIPWSAQKLVGQGLGGDGGGTEIAVRSSEEKPDEARAIRIEKRDETDPFAGQSTAPQTPGAQTQGATVRARRFDLVRAKEESIERKLEEPFSLEVIDEPLSSFAETLSQMLTIPVRVDGKALEENGMTSDSPVNGAISEVSLRSALHHLLEPLDLTIMVRDEILYITTPERLDSTEETRVYRPHSNGKAPINFNELAKVVQATLFVKDSEGRLNETCEVYAESLVIKGSLDLHQKVNDLLLKLGYEQPQ